MSDSPDTLKTIHVVLALPQRIPRNSKISAVKLQEQLSDAGLKRNLRTIQRQLEMLLAHFDIERDDSSKPYDYRRKERAKGISLSGMTQQKSLLLALAEEHMRNLLPANLLKSMASFLRKRAAIWRRMAMRQKSVNVQSACCQRTAAPTSAESSCKRLQ